ncbi:MAG: polysulfide reductase NrfD [Planctomycetaceae bacterium]|nr:polysulfide reductase NrfD [Planctomycetaceae bacterium]
MRIHDSPRRKATGGHTVSTEGKTAEQPPRSAILRPGETIGSVTDQISSIVLTRGTPRGWYLALAFSFSLLMLLLLSVTVLFARGIGIWGVNQPVGWGFAIVNFVWWVGIGHAGTLISAILLLLRQEWRTSINRFAEAMTLFAVACAGLFPLLHVGRPWLIYYFFPFPATTGMWPQFRSPLMWDAVAVGTYATVSLMFWYVGLIPDLATLRDRAKHTITRAIYGTLAMGWRGSAIHWERYHQAYVLLAALATPLVISVHTIVSFDFAVSIIPGWHTTVFPPYFVAGAIYSGFAMVLTLSIPLRAIYGLQNLITAKHLDNMAKVMLLSGLIVAYGYLMEHFVAWYGGHDAELFMLLNRMFGPYRMSYWALIACNVAIPQLLWFRRVRANVPLLFVLSIIVNIGMWLERYVIVITSLHRDALPSSWGNYTATFWDWSTYLGTIGLFLTLLFLFVRVLPVISISEMRELVEEHADEPAAKSEGSQT